MPHAWATLPATQRFDSFILLYRINVEINVKLPLCFVFLTEHYATKA
jgi:hypothetical protein